MKTIPLIATFFSLMSMVPELLKEKKRSEYSIEVTVLTLIGISLWLFHYYKEKNWMSAIEVVAALVINLQILYVILSKPKPEEHSVFRQTSDGVYGYTFEGCTERE